MALSWRRHRTRNAPAADLQVNLGALAAGRWQLDGAVPGPDKLPVRAAQHSRAWSVLEHRRCRFAAILARPFLGSHSTHQHIIVTRFFERVSKSSGRDPRATERGPLPVPSWPLCHRARDCPFLTMDLRHGRLRNRPGRRHPSSRAPAENVTVTI